MSSNKIFHWKLYLLSVAGIILMIVLLRIDWSGVAETLAQVGPKVLVLFPISVSAYIFGTVSWKFCLPVKFPFWDLFRFRQIGETLALLNPASIIAGDGAKHYFLKSKGISAEESMSSVILSRAILILTALFLLLLSGIYLIYATGINGSWPHLVVVGAIILFSMWKLLVGRNLYLFEIQKWLLAPWMKHRIIANYLIGMRQTNLQMSQYYSNHPTKLYGAFVFAVLHWLTGALEFYWIFKLLNIPISFLHSFVVEMGVVAIKNLGSMVPGQVGIEEFGNKAMIAIIGLTSPIVWVSVSILRRTRQLFWIGIGTLFYIQQK